MTREELSDREKAFAARETADRRRIVPLAEVTFRVEPLAEDLDLFEDGVCPWVTLEDAEPDIGRMYDPDEVVLPQGEYALLIDYPVERPAEIRVKPGHPLGFTRAGLARAVACAYRLLYEEEERTSTVKVIPPAEREGTYNRNETDGVHGIWGHDLADLALVSVRLEEDGGKRRLRLMIYS